MPAKYVIRNLRENCSYHVMHRGVEPLLFKDDQDQRVFEFYIFVATRPLTEILEKYPDLPSRLKGKNLHGEVRVEGECLLSDHFHLLVKQITRDGLPKLMKRVINGYTSYYNHKYQRVGSVVRGRYKAVMVKDEEKEEVLKLLQSHDQENCSGLG